jgi:hypothetical protein
MNALRDVFLAVFMIPLTSVCQDTLILQPSPDQGIDATVFSLYPNNTDPDNPLGHAAVWTYQGEPGTRRVYFSFDLSVFPPGTIITKAQLSLFGNDNPVWGVDEHSTLSGSNESYIRKAAGPWDEETINWNNQPGFLTDGQVLLPASLYGSQDYEDIDITKFVRDIVTSGEPNHGFVHMLQTEQYYRSKTFLTSDHPDKLNRPKLMVIFIGCPLQEVDFNYESDYKLITFNGATTSQSAYSWTWDFGDGSGSHNEDPVHYFKDEGVYEVCLTVEDTCMAVTYCDSVKICTGPVPGFTWLADGQLVSFFDTTSMAMERYWDFGDGDFSTVRDPIHYFRAFGEYTVCLDVTNGCKWDSICQPVLVSAAGIDDPGLPSWKIYPNPARDDLFICSAENPDVEYAIFALDGRIQQEGKLVSTAGHMGKINLQGIPTGLYMLRLSSGLRFGTLKLVVI